jgi:hypothetical protein
MLTEYRKHGTRRAQRVCGDADADAGTSGTLLARIIGQIDARNPVRCSWGLILPICGCSVEPCTANDKRIILNLVRKKWPRILGSVSFDNPVILGMSTDPYPDHVGAVLDSQGSIMQSNSRRPQCADFLEME